MRPGLDAEGEGLAGVLQNRSIEPVRPADHQHQVAHPVITQPGDPLGKGARGKRLAVFVTGDEMSLVDLRAQNFGLGGLAGLFRLDLDDGDGTQPQGSARCGRPLGIVTRELGLRASAQPADGEQGYLQFASAARWRESTAQIFSML